MKIDELLLEILKVSDKAACLARTIRAEESLFELLVQEKTGSEKNKRFVQDFKTLADVLVQQTILHDLGNKFPSLRSNIRGEESNKFTNVLGETVTVEVKSSVKDTAALLNVVLDDNMKAASLLAEVVHKEVSVVADDVTEQLAESEVDDSIIGIWIDPIDSTAQYINGYDSVKHETGLYCRGLQSVLVLIGVYDLHTGQPLMGVINQPFYAHDDSSNEWQGRVLWGVTMGNICAHSKITQEEINNQYLVLSSSESPATCKSLADHFQLIRASGGGYKLLTVIEHLVGGFVLSRATCFKWDSCGPHAILKSMGGGVLDLEKALECLEVNRSLSSQEQEELVVEMQLKYNKPDRENPPAGQKWSNSGGILAYTDIKMALKIMTYLM